jgi:alpha-galactosidase
MGPNNTVTFNNVSVPRTGMYEMQIEDLRLGPPALLFSVNGGPLVTVNVGGGSFNVPASTTVPVKLLAGQNSIQFGNPTSYPPDLDRNVIQGNGSAAPPVSISDEAENAVGRLSECGVLRTVLRCIESRQIFGGSGNGTVTFTQGKVPQSGNLSSGN